MAFDPKDYPFYFGPTLLGSLRVERPPTTIADMARALYPNLPSASPPTPPRNPFGGLFDPLPTSPPASNALAGLLGSYLDPTPTNALAGFGSPAPAPRLPVAPPVYRPAPDAKTRFAFFSFHYDDVHRTVIVRNAWRFIDEKHHSFRDSSIWEKSKTEDPENVKRIIRAGVEGTSVICVLVGTETYSRRFVRYEISRAITDKRGLLAVHVNGIRHHRAQVAHQRGMNPLECMAVGKVQSNALARPQYFLFEKLWFDDAFGRRMPGWYRYKDHQREVDLPSWLPDPAAGYVTPLSYAAKEYDYNPSLDQKNIGVWLDRAARQAGRI
jgi:hypothetical protein